MNAEFELNGQHINETGNLETIFPTGLQKSLTPKSKKINTAYSLKVGEQVESVNSVFELSQNIYSNSENIVRVEKSMVCEKGKVVRLEASLKILLTNDSTLYFQCDVFIAGESDTPISFIGSGNGEEGIFF